jgi:hypothetical protein
MFGNVGVVCREISKQNILPYRFKEITLLFFCQFIVDFDASPLYVYYHVIPLSACPGAVQVFFFIPI